jgi:Ca2+-binding RTX toxin-like protein
VLTNAGYISGGQIQVYHDFEGNYEDADIYAAVLSIGSLRLTNAASGVIEGAIYTDWVSTITNVGKIYGTIDGAVDSEFVNNAGKVNVNRNYDANGNQILTDRGDISITDSRFVGLTVNNTGLIDGHDSFNVFEREEEGASIEVEVAISGTNARDVITNSATGVMYGNVSLRDGNNAVTNAGQIFGRVITDNGNDVITNAATGKIVGYVGTLGFYDAVFTGSGNDSLANAGQIFGDVNMEDGNDTVTGAGSIFGNLLADNLNVQNGVEAAQVAGDGNDSVTIAARGVVDGFVYLGHGNNTFTNAGTVFGEETLQFTALDGQTTVGGVVVARSGNDTMTNSASGIIYGAVDLGDGNNTLTNQGRILGDMELEDGEFDYYGSALVKFGNGNDRLTNSGTIGSETPLFSGNRFVSTNLFAELANSGDDADVGLAVSMGDGADIINNTGRIYGFISAGSGADTVNGGAFNEFVFEEDGADVYNLGAGADAILITAADTHRDVMYGGAGIDLLGFSGLQDGADMGEDGEPLPSLGHRIEVGAGTNMGTIIYNVSGFNDTTPDSATPNDVFLGFEQFLGSSGDDVILGGTAAETIVGGYGNDTISGGGGKDYLIGGVGADVFLFGLATHSGRTRATRDVIEDFETEVDQIALTFDSNTRSGAANAGIQDDFVFIGMNQGFQTATQLGTEFANFAQVRAIWAGTSTIIEVDTNGDRRADFSIELAGRITLTDDTFIFGNSAFQSTIEPL